MVANGREQSDQKIEEVICWGGVKLRPVECQNTGKTLGGAGGRAIPAASKDCR